MRPIVIATDAVLLSFVKAVLADAGIEVVALDRFTSVIEGSIGALPQRLLVHDEAWEAARDALVAQGVGNEVIADDVDGGLPAGNVP